MRSVLVAALFAVPLVAQFSGSFVLPVEDEALGYNKAADDPVARLQAKLERGDAKLNYAPAQGYLLSVLKELNIPVESQVLVFSKTSFQQSLIAPWTPRALDFNDDVYMGFVQNGEVLEVHPSCLAAHLVAGWTVSSASLPVSETKPASSTTRRGRQPRQSITE